MYWLCKFPVPIIKVKEEQIFCYLLYGLTTFLTSSVFHTLLIDSVTTVKDLCEHDLIIRK